MTDKQIGLVVLFGLAVLCFAAAAASWPPAKRVNLIGAGLALAAFAWVLQAAAVL